MSHLLLSVPPTVTSHYVIATSEPPADPYAVVPWRVPAPFRRPVIEALKAPGLGIFTIAADEETWRLDDVLACDDDLRRVRSSSHRVVVAHEAATVDQPHREQIARAVARALADAANGVLIDPQARQVVLRDGLARAERSWFRMGDQWFGTRYERTGRCDDGTAGGASRLAGAHGRSAVAEVSDPAGHGDSGTTRGGAALSGEADPAGCCCLRITLLGLRRFGLPDLVLDRVPCARDLPALNLLRAVACRLLTDQWRWARGRPAGYARAVDDHPKIEPADFWAYWGATPFADGRPLVVRLVATSATTLEVTPPADHVGTRAEWAREVLAAAMPPVVGCPADEDAPGVSGVTGDTRRGHL